VHAGVGVGDAARDEREVVGIPGDPGQAGHLLLGLRERAALAPRPVEPEAGHAHVDDAGIDRQHLLPGEAPVLDDPRREVLDEHVGPLHELQEQRAPALGRDIEREVELVGVDHREHVAVLPPPLGAEHGTGEPHAVGMGDRLDVDHLRAEHGQHVGAGGTGPPRREVEHLHPRQRERGGIGTGVGRPRPDARLHVALVLAEPRRAPRRRHRVVVEPVGRTRPEHTVVVGEEHAAGDHVLVRRQRRRVVHR
jgi:hypothetical protein